MPAAQFNAWRAYYRVSPFGSHRSDINSGIIAATMANIYLKKGGKPLTPEDFIPKWENKSPSQSTSDDIERKITQFMSTY